MIRMRASRGPSPAAARKGPKLWERDKSPASERLQILYRFLIHGSYSRVEATARGLVSSMHSHAAPSES